MENGSSGPTCIVSGRRPMKFLEHIAKQGHTRATRDVFEARHMFKYSCCRLLSEPRGKDQWREHDAVPRIRGPER